MRSLITLTALMLMAVAPLFSAESNSSAFQDQLDVAAGELDAEQKAALAELTRPRERTLFIVYAQLLKPFVATAAENQLQDKLVKSWILPEELEEISNWPDEYLTALALYRVYVKSHSAVPDDMADAGGSLSWYEEHTHRSDLEGHSERLQQAKSMFLRLEQAESAYQLGRQHQDLDLQPDGEGKKAQTAIGDGARVDVISPTWKRRLAKFWKSYLDLDQAEEVGEDEIDAFVESAAEVADDLSKSKHAEVAAEIHSIASQLLGSRGKKSESMGHIRAALDIYDGRFSYDAISRFATLANYDTKPESAIAYLTWLHDIKSTGIAEQVFPIRPLAMITGDGRLHYTTAERESIISGLKGERLGVYVEVAVSSLRSKFPADQQVADAIDSLLKSKEH